MFSTIKYTEILQIGILNTRN